MAGLFGTDGIRGRANTFPITCEIAVKTGRAVGNFVRKNQDQFLIIGRDTRVSGHMLEAALAAGASSAGVEVRLAGVIPTPGVAYLCSCLKGAGAGIVISASHNPYYDNGIKIFRKGGIKLTDAQEEEIESRILNDQDDVSQKNIGKISIISDSLDKYAAFLLSRFPIRKPQGPGENPLKLIIDASNGAASKIGRMVFGSGLFDPLYIFDQPNGCNINEKCGSQHTDTLKKRVIEEKADAGLAFDGDADRLIAVDETGKEISGDQILAICAKYAKKKGSLKNNTLVSTIMSNIGLTETLDSLGIRHLKSDVGDRKVLEEMMRSGAVIGGEDSGHMIFLEDHTTGDGILSALKLLEIMMTAKKPLSELASIMTVYPMVLINVEVDASRPDFKSIPPIAKTIDQVEEKLSGRGRVLIRYSGTQPLLRVMVEGPDQDQTLAYCEKICQSIRENIA
ncbi:phosphoglucosamine mutase [Desulfospira joergensenii]|uniref:phosphoglucosamine mutase n=1 Tax=Desulfospira joergensenii TaxID=53329 RepID=UPI0003B2E892|nr:phosphoglucosamine mutase [Desulfospira joergensenii]